MRRLLLLASACLSFAAVARAAPANMASSLGFDLAGRDLAVQPGDNFFRYANGTALDRMTIPPDRSSFGSFVALAELSARRVHEILEKAAAGASGTPADTTAKMGAFYRSFMDEAAVEKDGAQPIQAELAMIRGASTPADFARLTGLGQKTLLGSLFELDIEPDAKDPTRYAVDVAQSGLGLPDRDYYLSKDFAAQKAKYQQFAAQALQLAGWPDPTGAAARVVAFETAVAQASWSPAESRDDDKTYNPVAVTDLPKVAPGFDWGSYFAAADLGAQPRVVLQQNTAIVKIAALVGNTPIGTLRDWAALHLVIDAAPYLSRNFDQASFAFFGTELEGQPQQQDRWKRAVKATEGAMGDAIGRIYADEYYPPAARAAMTQLTADLRDAFRRRLEHNAWMSPQTRKLALQKLGTFYFLIGAPKHWRDYGPLTVRADDLCGNVERGTAQEWAFWVGHLGKPVDREQWEMFPQTVNAYNEPLLNEVVFPAAILQPPFFDPKADPAINYGGIGGVIGHEMTHSFDDQGRKHDALGRLHNWWTAADAQRFEERAQKYGAQFAAMTLPDMGGAHINPELTMGENIADLGGLTLALDAYHASLHGKPAPVIDGLTGDQRVFLGWAQVWRIKVRPAAARQYLTVDPHSPPIARVNGPAHNIDAWYAAFGVKPGQALYLPPDQRVRIW
jgi:putative endopeptidase